jgi:arylsulfatase A-like enzyme
VFENAYAPMPQTLPSHATLFTGLPPRRHGALENAYVLSGAAETLAEWASVQGYETAAFIGARILDDTTGMEQGFDVYDQPTGVARDKQHPVERSAAAVTDSALAWAITKHASGRPFVLWAHYYDAHGPWEPAARRISREAVRRQVEQRPEFASLPAQGSAEALGFNQVLGMWHGYDNEIAEVDSQVSRLLRGLGERGMLKDAVVLIVGDHGEGLMEHNEKGHGVNVFQELMQVPLVLIAPDGELAGTRVSSPMQMQDVLPTVLALVGAPQQMDLPGRNVLPDLRAGREPSVRPIFVERPHYSPGGERYRRAFAHGWGFGELVGVIEGDDKLVRYPDGSVQLFDLTEDPDELVNLATERAEVAERLEGLLDEWLASNAVEDFGAEQDISPERRAILKALGYIGGEGNVAPKAEASPDELSTPR